MDVAQRDVQRSKVVIETRRGDLNAIAVLHGANRVAEDHRAKRWSVDEERERRHKNGGRNGGTDPGADHILSIAAASAHVKYQIPASSTSVDVTAENPSAS